MNVDELVWQLQVQREALEIERSRVDYLVALSEGLLEERARFEKARGEKEFQKPYEKRQPLVSVCVATCDRSHLLIERALASLLRQTYQNLQIIVVGDHCTDDTEYRLAKIRDSRVHFENLETRGPYPRPGVNRWRVAGTMATNRAMDLAEGDFIAHLDDDDESDPERFEVLVRAAKQSRAELLWHRFLAETPPGIWVTLGGPDLVLGQVTTGSIFYHRYLARTKWDPTAYRWQEPGDWNRLRKIKFLLPKLHFVDRILMTHYREGQQAPFTAQPDEQFLD